MPGNPLGAAARQFQRLFGAGTSSGLTDDQLLARFVSSRDDAAFEALVQRHGPMVLSVCQGVLKDPNDSQDAFQATFLVLVRKAGSIRAGGSLGSWLYRVAYNMAMQINAEAARRREVERRAAEMANPNGRADPRREDLIPALYEEVNRLPEKYRLPVALCHLERMTYAQAAHHLGWTEGRVRGRLDKARRLLRSRLSRRGLALSGVVLAEVLSERAALAAVPAGWMDATVAAAMAIATGRAATAGAVSAAAVALSERMVRSMVMTTMSYHAVVLLAVGGAAGLAATLLAVRPQEGAGRQDAPAAARAAPAAVKPADRAPGEDAKPVPIAGRVVDPDGKPLPAATIYVRHSHWYDWGQEARAVERVATAGPDGRFRFDLDPAKSDAPVGDGPAWHSAEVAATAPGYGPAWVEAGAAARGGVELRLVPDGPPIHGRFLDTQARPIAGATVRVERLATLLKGVDRDALLASRKLDWDGIHVRSIERRDWWWPTWIGRGGAVTTDSDGRIAITGVGRDQVALLRLEQKGLEYSRVAVLDRAPQVPSRPRPQQSPTFDPLYGEMGMELYAATFEHVVGPSKPITGVVRLKGTGRPVAGVTVAGGFRGLGWSMVFTRTDEHGRYRLEGLRKAETHPYLVDVRPEPGSPYLAALTVVADTAGLQPIEVPLELPPGVAVRGRVIDKQTGRAVPCDWVEYFPMPSNPHKGNAHGIASGTDNTFRITVPPGGGMIAVKARGKSHPYPAARLAPNDKGKLVVKGEDGAEFGIPLSYFNAYRFVEFPDGVESATVDLEVTPGITHKGELVGPDGRPVVGAQAHGLTTDRFASATLEGATFEVQGLRPEESRLVEFRHEGLGLAGSATVAGSAPEERPLVVPLARCGSIAGRLLDEDNQPLRAAKVSAVVVSRRGYQPSDPAFQPREGLTDQAGRFRIEGINPTLGVSLWIQNPNDRARQSEAKPDKDLNTLTVKPGEVLDLGEVRVRFQPVQ